MKNPLEGWPKCDTPYPSGNSTLAPPNPVACPAFEGVSPREVVAWDSKDPLPASLLASRANRALPREFRILDGHGRTVTLIADLPCVVWEIEDRAANKGRRSWRSGVCLGLNAGVALSAELKSTPPALRGSGLRAILCALSHPGRAGFPASMNTDASLGLAAMA